MLTSLELKGFQSHLHTKIDFVGGVNILVGQSRNGKTAVLRALRWLTENRPIGIDGFITHGQKEISVTLQLDGHTIVRRKNNRENVYILDGEKFAGIGSNVPEPVARMLNLSDLNISSQFDQPYLLFDSPGQVAQQLNAVVHLDQIDTALAAAASMKRANDQDMRVQEARVEELKALEASFPDLEAAEEFIEELEGKWREQTEKKGRLNLLQTIGQALFDLTANLVITRLPEGMEERVAALRDKSIHRSQLEYTTDALHAIQTDLAKNRFDVGRLSGITKFDGAVQNLSSKNSLVGGKAKALGRLRTYAITLTTHRERLGEETAIITVQESKFKQMFPEVCPLCNQPIKKS